MPQTFSIEWILDNFRWTMSRTIGREKTLLERSHGRHSNASLDSEFYTAINEKTMIEWGLAFLRNAADVFLTNCTVLTRLLLVLPTTLFSSLANSRSKLKCRTRILVGNRNIPCQMRRMAPNDSRLVCWASLLHNAQQVKAT